jgi:hypothetical protein
MVIITWIFAFLLGAAAGFAIMALGRESESFGLVGLVVFGFGVGWMWIFEGAFEFAASLFIGAASWVALRYWLKEVRPRLPSEPLGRNE